MIVKKSDDSKSLLFKRNISLKIICFGSREMTGCWGNGYSKSNFSSAAFGGIYRSINALLWYVFINFWYIIIISSKCCLIRKVNLLLSSLFLTIFRHFFSSLFLTIPESAKKRSERYLRDPGASNTEKVCPGRF